jgi:GR25 family glycosyltransferase involved in LPS biosynthesis
MIYYYINLDRVPERASFIEKQVETLGLHSQLQRMSATDALTMPQQSGYLPKQWGPRWEMTASEIACFISHRRCWATIVKKNLQHAVIMEDDIIISADLDLAVRDIVQCASQDFDVVKLDGVPQVRRFGPPMTISRNRHLREILQVTASASCYLVSYLGAKKLLSESTHFCNHLDDFVFSPRKGRKIFQLEPSVAVQAIWSNTETIQILHDNVKTSERTHKPEINAKKSKGPTAYRLMKEVKRTSQKLSRTLYSDRALKAVGGVICMPRLANDLGSYTTDF